MQLATQPAATTMIRCEVRSNTKRQRGNSDPSENVKAEHTVNQLYRAVTSQQRLATSQALLRQLSHSEALVCNSLIKAGLNNALCLQLGFIINQPDTNDTAREEVETICWIFNSLFRGCSESAREESINSFGHDLFHLLMKGMRLGAILSTLSVFHICSGSLQGTSMLLQAGILSCISRSLQHHTNDDNTLLETLGLMKNLSYYGENYRLEMAEHAGLLPKLAHIPFSHPNNEKALERLSALIRNLAVSTSTRPILAQKSYILNAIARMGSHSSRYTQRNLLNILLSLGQEVDACIILCLHGDGVLINLLKRFLNHETDAAVRKRAARMLRMLACEGSASLLVHDSSLIDCLSQRALHDERQEVRTEAIDAIIRLAAFINAPMPQHKQVLDTFTQLASCSRTQPEILAQALRKQASQTSNQSSLIERRILLESLAQMALSQRLTNESKELACAALLDLTEHESNRGKLATCSILEALTQNAKIRNQNHDGGNDDPRKLYGIQALINLASVPTNRKAMANHNLLLQTLVLYAASTRDEQIKRNVKKVILMLVSEL